ncbi:MAG: PhoU domain-containing protein [Fervidicoccaceae archaeon]
MPIYVPEKIEYKPLPLALVLREMKTLSSLALDLAYYSTIYADLAIARLVLKLEHEVDARWALAAMQASLSSRSPKNSERIVGLLKVINALDAVSDAAGDLASVVMLMPEKVGLKILLQVLSKSEERICRLKVNSLPKPSARIVDITSFPRHSDVLIVERGETMTIEPPPDFALEVGDVLLLRGTEEALKSVAELLGDYSGLEEARGLEVEEPLRELVRYVVDLKNTSEVALDLAFYSVISGDKALALEVVELEEQTDSHYVGILKLLHSMSEKISAKERVLLTVLLSTLERVADAAWNIASVAASDYEVSEVLERAERESNEVVIRAIAREEASGSTIGDARLDDVGAHVLALKTRSGKWLPLPDETTRLEPGDELVLKLYSEKDPNLVETLRVRGLELIHR